MPSETIESVDKNELIVEEFDQPIPEALPPSTDRPIIGILAIDTYYYLDDYYPEATMMIGASYVKFVEQGGARVVPILHNKTDDYYEMMFRSTNGFLLTGGGVNISDSGTQMCQRISQERKILG